MSPSSKSSYPVFDPDRRCQPGEEEPAAAKDPPHFGDHLFELRLVFGEMENRAADDSGKVAIREWQLIEPTDSEVLRRKRWSQPSGEGLDITNLGRIRVDAEDLGSAPHQVV